MTLIERLINIIAAGSAEQVKEARDALQSAIEALQAEVIGLRSECADLKRQWTEWNSSLDSVMKQRNDIRAERDALAAKLVPLEADAERYRWLRERYTAVNFDWEESGQQAVIFTADNFPIATSSCDETIDAAIDAAKGGQHEDKN